MNVDFTWTGSSLPSKKNCKKIGYIIRNRKRVPIILNSDEYEKWEKEFAHDIRKLNPVWKWKSAVFTFYSPTLGVWDLSNKLESIMDGMKVAKFIVDDSWKYCPDQRTKYGGKTTNWEWKVVADITV